MSRAKSRESTKRRRTILAPYKLRVKNKEVYGVPGWVRRHMEKQRAKDARKIKEG